MKGRTVFVIAHRLSTVRNSTPLSCGERRNHRARRSQRLIGQKGVITSFIPVSSNDLIPTGHRDWAEGRDASFTSLPFFSYCQDTKGSQIFPPLEGDIVMNDLVDDLDDGAAWGR